MSESTLRSSNPSTKEAVSVDLKSSSTDETFSGCVFGLQTVADATVYTSSVNHIVVVLGDVVDGSVSIN